MQYGFNVFLCYPFGGNTLEGLQDHVLDSFTAGSFAATRINANNPNLQATSGTLQFGFIQWGASTGGDVDPAVDFTNSIDSFEVEIGFTAVPEPSAATLFGLTGLALMLRRRR